MATAAPCSDPPPRRLSCPRPPSPRIALWRRAVAGGSCARSAAHLADCRGSSARCRFPHLVAPSSEVQKSPAEQRLTPTAPRALLSCHRPRESHGGFRQRYAWSAKRRAPAGDRRGASSLRAGREIFRRDTPQGGQAPARSSPIRLPPEILESSSMDTKNINRAGAAPAPTRKATRESDLEIKTKNNT